MLNKLPAWIAPLLLILLTSGVYATYWFAEQQLDGMYLILSMEDFWLADVGHLLTLPVFKGVAVASEWMGWEDRILVCQRLNTLFSILALLGMWSGLQILSNQPFSSLMATLLVAFSPSYWYYSEFVEYFALHLCVLSWLFVWLVHRWRADPFRDGRFLMHLKGSDLLTFGGLALLAVSTHIIAVFWGIALFLAWIFSGTWREDLQAARNLPRNQWVKPFIYFLGVLILFATLGMWLADAGKAYYHSRAPFFQTDPSWLIQAGPLWNLLGQMKYTALLWLLAVPGLFFFIKGKCSRFVKLFVMLSLLIYLGFFAFWVPDHGGFLLPVVPLLITLGVYGVHNLFPQGSVVVLLTCLLLQGVPTWKWISTESVKTEAIDQALEIGAKCGPQDLVVANILVPWILFYTDCDLLRLHLAWSGLNSKPDITYEEWLLERMQTTLASGGALWWTNEAKDFLQKENAFPRIKEWAKETLQLESSGTVWRASFALPVGHDSPQPLR